MTLALDPLELIDFYGADSLVDEIDTLECERDFARFYAEAWPSFDPAPFMSNWHVDAIADHLMAVTDGDIRKLLINVPYRTGKTGIVSVAWPPWTWAQRHIGALSGPQVRFLCLSYGAKLSLETATTSRRLISSDWYQQRWGHRVMIAADQDNKEKFDTTAGGSRISTGFDGSTLGRGGAIKIIDDPHKVDEAESDQVREGVLRTYDESLASRFTDPRTSAEVIIMQRLHENDLSGYVLEKNRGFVHLCLPAEYDPGRHCVTVLRVDESGDEEIWQDPRGLDEDGEPLEGEDLEAAAGTLLWEERFTRTWIEAEKARLGPYAAAGQLQQMPAPRGGGIIRTEWWKLWPDTKFPDFGSVIVSLDTAYTEREENDYSAATVWGAFADTEGRPKLMLKDAWQARLVLSDLVFKVAEICRKHKADILLVEAKANGLDVINEIRRLYGTREWQTIGIDPKGDKVARLQAIQPLFSGAVRKDPITGMESWSGGLIFAPDKEWAQMVIDACASFPRTKYRDLVDTVSQALKYMRENGVAVSREEHDESELEARKFKRPPRAAYDV